MKKLREVFGVWLLIGFFFTAAVISPWVVVDAAMADSAPMDNDVDVP